MRLSYVSETAIDVLLQKSTIWIALGYAHFPIILMMQQNILFVHSKNANRTYIQAYSHFGSNE